MGDVSSSHRMGRGRLESLVCRSSSRLGAGVCGLIAVLALLSVTPSLAQTGCDLLLEEAEKRYVGGEFDKAQELLETCLKSKPPRQQRDRAQALLAKSYLANDERRKARTLVDDLLSNDPDFKPQDRDSARFKGLVELVKRESATVTVASVSKSDEPLREAPATVVVVTAEEIAERGYTDLVAVLHDLPGFDISRSAGPVYANIYQRGLRSDTTNRTLVLVDGVEENDLFIGGAFFSRQFSVSDVQRIEVIYGPASTMYGANAFAGVINIITKSPTEILEAAAKARGSSVRSIGAQVEATAGSFDTRLLETTVAGEAFDGDLRWSVTGRTFKSDEPDLSTFEEWSYDPGFFTSPANLSTYRQSLGFVTSAQDPRTPQQFIAGLCTTGAGLDADCVTRFEQSPLVEITGDAIALTDAGLAEVVRLDQAAYLTPFRGSPVGPSNESDDWMVRAKLESSYFEIGVQSWRKNEGLIGSYTNFLLPGSANDAVWIPKQTTFYLRYARPFKERNLKINFFTRFKRQELDGQSFFPVLTTYLFAGRGLRDLVEGKPAGWEGFYFHRNASQLRGEFSLSWQPSKKLSMVSGLEFRSSSIPASFIISPVRDPEVSGFPANSPDGGNQVSSQDFAFYTQLSYKPWAESRDDHPLEDFKVVLGGRFDHNEVRSVEGFGTVFNPRLALVYPRGDYVFKAIFAQAFQAPSNFQKFTVTPGIQEAGGDDLSEEKISNLELAAGWQPTEHSAVELSAYEASVSDIVDLLPNPATGLLKNQNTGSLRIRGAQLLASHKFRNYRFWGNYTYTDSVSEAAAGDVVVGDIADNQINLGIDAVFREKFNVDLRFNWVDSKPTGANTTAASNPLTSIDSYFVTHATFTWRNVLPGVKLSLIVNNLFDDLYFHPGVRTADGFVFSPRLPQPERAVFLRVSATF